MVSLMHQHKSLLITVMIEARNSNSTHLEAGIELTKNGERGGRRNG